MKVVNQKYPHTEICWSSTANLIFDKKLGKNAEN